MFISTEQCINMPQFMNGKLRKRWEVSPRLPYVKSEPTSGWLLIINFVQSNVHQKLTWWTSMLSDYHGSHIMGWFSIRVLPVWISSSEYFVILIPIMDNWELKSIRTCISVISVSWLPSCQSYQLFIFCVLQLCSGSRLEWFWYLVAGKTADNSMCIWNKYSRVLLWHSPNCKILHK